MDRWSGPLWVWGGKGSQGSPRMGVGGVLQKEGYSQSILLSSEGPPLEGGSLLSFLFPTPRG